MLTEEQKKKKRKRALMIGAVVLGVFLLIGCCSTGGYVLSGTYDWAMNTPLPVPTLARPPRTPTPQEVVEPTPTEIYVPVAATATATTESTFTPTSVPEVTPTSTYRAEMPALLLQYVEAQEVTAALNRQVAADPTLLFDDQWKVDIALSLGHTLIIGSEIRALDPPPEFREAHDCIVKATEHYDAFIHLYSTGVDTLDASLIAQAADELALVAEWMDKATEALPD